MRVGVVSKWFNRGQPVVGRQTRSALDELGHETFVLARPKKERGPRPGALDRDDVWDQPGVTEASTYDIPGAEYERWVSENGIEAIFCDQNYQFAELAALEFVADRRTKRRFDPNLKVGPQVSAACLSRGMIARAMPQGDILGFTYVDTDGGIRSARLQVEGATLRGHLRFAGNLSVMTGTRL